jgi:predicted dehydrogenase
MKEVSRLTLSSAAIAHGVTATLKTLAAELDSERRIRVGVVGGGFGCAFQWHEHPNCEVVAVSDLRTDRRARLTRTYGCERTYESLEKLIRADDIEAVALFTPAPDHLRHCELVLNAGKHVICAVPAAMTLEECERLTAAVERTGLTYMMAETSYYQQPTISARKFFQAGEFGRIISVESEYHHAGLESLWFEGGRSTWRHGLPPMNYPTHCTAHLIGVTGERIERVTCVGWGDRDPLLEGNPYQNPFWNETAFFVTDRGNPFHVDVWWKGAHRGGERACWFGDRMSFFFPSENGLGSVLVHAGKLTELDSGGFTRQRASLEPYEQPDWWRTEALPEALRHDSGHEGSHTFLTHEFISALIQERRPAVDVYEAVAYTAPGIVAHQSALRGGEQLDIPDFGP